MILSDDRGVEKVSPLGFLDVRNEVVLEPGASTIGGDDDDLGRSGAAVRPSRELARTHERTLALVRFDLFDG